MKAVLHTDGGARGNPGPAAIGLVLEFPNSRTPPVERAECIGEATNNVAEYRALLTGLQEARDRGATDVACFLDSELVVRQLNGEYKIKDAKLRHLAGDVRLLAGSFARVTFAAVPRENNLRADALVNAALDREMDRTGEKKVYPKKNPGVASSG